MVLESTTATTHLALFPLVSRLGRKCFPFITAPVYPRFNADEGLDNQCPLPTIRLRLVAGANLRSTSPESFPCFSGQRPGCVIAAGLGSSVPGLGIGLLVLSPGSEQ